MGAISPTVRSPISSIPTKTGEKSSGYLPSESPNMALDAAELTPARVHRVEEDKPVLRHG
jgi:hypothetical protein